MMMTGMMKRTVAILLLLAMTLGVLNSKTKTAMAVHDSTMVPPEAGTVEADAPTAKDVDPAPSIPETTCGPDTFRCHESFFDYCISQERVCDGVKDCEGGEDEMNCNNIDHDFLPTEDEYQEETWMECGENEFKCGNSQRLQCIPKSKVCDTKRDCEDGSDEGERCNECQYLECSHTCEESPHGPKCTCPDKMRLSIDELTCEFPDHCAQLGHLCSQFCSESIDKLVCKCADGYELKEDEHTCVPSEDKREGVIYFSKDGHSIQSAQLYSSDSAVVVKDLLVDGLPDTHTITSMTYDQEHDVLYLVANAKQRMSEVYKLDMVSKAHHAKSLLHGHGVKHIAYDWVTKNLYYAIDGVGIGVCSSNGKFCQHLISLPHHKEGELAQHYVDLIVHPKRGLLVWLEIDGEHPTGVVRVAGMDGKKVRAVGHLTASKLRSISLDYVRDKLFMFETGGPLTELDLHTLQTKPIDTEIRDAKGMIIFGGYRYYIDGIRKALVRHGMTDHVKETLLSHVGGSDAQSAMTIDNELYYDTRVANPCDKANCPYLCVLQEKKLTDAPLAKCLCPDKYSEVDGGAKCVYDRDVDGPVRASGTRAMEMCRNAEICHPGICPIKWDDVKTPACDCRSGYSGLYCEIKSTTMEMVTEATATTKPWVLKWVIRFLIVSLGVGIIYYLVQRFRPEWLDSVYDLFDFRGGASSNFDPYRVSPFKNQAPRSSVANSTSKSQGGESAIKDAAMEKIVTFTNPAYNKPAHPAMQDMLDV